MKKDENSGVSIKQILLTTMFLTVATLGGLSAYRVVCKESVQTIQEIESANLENLNYEMALVENTEDDFIHSENIKFLAVKIVNESGETINFEEATTQDMTLASNGSNEVENTKENIIKSEKNYGEKVISRGNYVREIVADNIVSTTNEQNSSNKLLNAVVNEIKVLSEKQEAIIENLNSDLKENIENDLNSEVVVESINNEGTSVSSTNIDASSISTTENTQLENNESENIQVESEQVESEAVQNTTVQPEAIQVEVPTGAPSNYIKTIDVKATAYCLCKKCCGKSPSNPAYGITASGLKIIPGTGMKVVASDPTVIPLGTEVYIEGLYGAKDYGYAIVADTGSAIKNLKIDLYMDTHQMALNWGVKTVRVYILDK